MISPGSAIMHGPVLVVNQLQLTGQAHPPKPLATTKRINIVSNCNCLFSTATSDADLSAIALYQRAAGERVLTHLLINQLTPSSPPLG